MEVPPLLEPKLNAPKYAIGQILFKVHRPHDPALITNIDFEAGHYFIKPLNEKLLGNAPFWNNCTTIDNDPVIRVANDANNILKEILDK